MTIPTTTSRDELIQAVHTAAQDATANIGTPGASDRVVTLGATLENLAANDPEIAVIVAAARWTDRYGSAGAPGRLADLQDTVDTLRGIELLLAAPERPFDNPEQEACSDGCSCQRDAPADALNVVVEEPRLIGSRADEH